MRLKLTLTKNIGVFANDTDKQQFNRAYDPYAYHGENQQYRQRKSVLEELSVQGKLYDDYTGKNISEKNFIVNENGNAREQNRFDVEHFNAAKSIHDNDEVRFSMTEEQSANLANNEKNLGATAYSINRSKGDKDFDAWKNTERAEFANKKNSELYCIDCELADKKIKESKEFIKTEGFKAKAKNMLLQIEGQKSAVPLDAARHIAGGDNVDAGMQYIGDNNGSRFNRRRYFYFIDFFHHLKNHAFWNRCCGFNGERR